LQAKKKRFYASLFAATNLIIGNVKQLYLIRHCESLAAEKDAHPRDDSPLSENGCGQAARLAEYLRPMPVDLFLTSIFQRAQQTAAILNKERNARVFSAIALNEYFLRDDFRGVETSEQGLVRSLGFLNQFRPFFDNVAVVAHNSILSTILMSLLNMPFSSGKDAFARTGTCRILRYDISEGDENWKETDLFIP
jgi:broad specificity phosphatase PhoE